MIAHDSEAAPYIVVVGASVPLLEAAVAAKMGEGYTPSGAITIAGTYNPPHGGLLQPMIRTPRSASKLNPKL